MACLLNSWIKGSRKKSQIHLMTESGSIKITTKQNSEMKLARKLCTLYKKIVCMPSKQVMRKKKNNTFLSLSMVRENFMKKAN